MAAFQGIRFPWLRYWGGVFNRPRGVRQHPPPTLVPAGEPPDQGNLGVLPLLEKSGNRNFFFCNIPFWKKQREMKNMW